MLWIVAKEGLPLWLGTWTVSQAVVVGMAIGGRFFSAQDRFERGVDENLCKSTVFACDG